MSLYREAKYDRVNQLSASAALLKTSHPQKKEVKKESLSQVEILNSHLHADILVTENKSCVKDLGDATTTLSRKLTGFQ